MFTRNNKRKECFVRFVVEMYLMKNLWKIYTRVSHDAIKNLFSLDNNSLT